MRTLMPLPFLTALIVAIAAMPTHVYQICAWQIGTAKTDPWRSKASALRERARSLVATMLASLRGLGWQPVVALVVLAILLTTDAHAAGLSVAIVVPAGLKALRQSAVDIDAELAATSAEIQKLSAKVTGEKRAMTDAEKTELAALKAKVADLKSLKDTNAELLVEAEAANERQRTAAAVPDADAAAAAAALAAGRVTVTDRVADDPKKGFKDHKEFLGAVMDAGRGRKIDARLLPLRATQGTDEQQGSQDPYGGFLVPHGVAPGILQIAPEDDPVSALTTKPPMKTPTVSFNARVDKDHTTSVSGGLVVTRRPETVDGSSSRMKFEQVTLTANELFGLAYATERIITDSPESFVAVLAAGFKDEYAAKAMDERLNGSGVGEPLGVLHANNGSKIEVAKETGQVADTIVKENIDKMVSRCWRPGRAIWLANHDTRPQLRSLAQNVGTGGAPVPYFTIEGGKEYLDGKLIFFTEFASKLGDVGDLILAVWSEYYEGEYVPMQSDESIHVRFAAGERCFRFYKRNDGQPSWRAALTPKKSAATLSPFVTLAAR